ncbi:MAG: hypothetical protein JWQ85_55, partial [Mucilaginibacter sp.]|nr:hypothetical protein [Mucilaginibacter sp.]
FRAKPDAVVKYSKANNNIPDFLIIKQKYTINFLISNT